MNDTMTKNFEQFADMMKAAVPHVKTNKNGYEIRTKVLEFAQNNVWQDYHAKWGQFETTTKKDGDEVVTEVVLCQKYQVLTKYWKQPICSTIL